MPRVSSLKFLVLGAATCGLLAAGATSAFALSSKFDGMYSIQVTTQDGSCGNSQWTVNVAGAQIASVSPNTAGIRALGIVESDGVVSMTFRGGANHYAHVGGQIKGRTGKGTWSAPTLLCGGVWRAQKVK
ncbi:MAG TPA: hypothetical protein VIJ06_04075 [Methylovirgula sp.]